MKKMLTQIMLLSSIGAFSQNMVDVDFPQPRSGAAFIYHPEKKALLLVGGLMAVPDPKESDIWKWDGKSWSKISAAGPGSINFSQAIAYNPNSRKIYSFAGYDMFDDFKNDLWASDGGQWARAKATFIGGRIHHSMVYANHLNAFVLYGGFTENRDNDTTTWLLKDGIFTALKIRGPGTRHQFSMAYDRSRKKVVLYGGTEGSNELWEFDGSNWTKIANGKINPGNRARHQMVYDDHLKMIVLHGGDPRGTIPSTWGWNGIVWKKLAQENLDPIVMGYDEMRKVVVAYGTNEKSELHVWELSEGNWKSVGSFGKWSSSEFRKKWMEEHPDDVSPLAQHSFDLLFSKKYEDAEKSYKKIEKVYPQNMTVLANLTLVLLKQGKTEEAKMYLQKIDNAGTMKRYLCVRLAFYLKENKLYPESARYFEKALSIEPRGADYYNLACVNTLMGDNDKAFENLNLAIANGFNSRNQIENDSNLSALKNDPRWASVLKQLK